MNLLRFSSPQSWTQTITSLWRDRLRSNPRLRMCLASGHTPKSIYAAIAQSVASAQTTFKTTEIFSLDDYGGLAPDDVGLARNLLARDLLDHIDLPPDRFYPVNTHHADLDSICDAYNSLIDANNFDLTLLGLGLNGHIGMNEPGTSPDTITRRVDLPATTVAASKSYFTHDNLPTWGIGVGLKQLLASGEIWLLVNGAHKADIIHRALTGDITPDVPASLLRNHPNCYFFLDPAAAARL